MELDPVRRTLQGLAFAAAAALVLGMGYWMLSPGGGPDEFARAQQALRGATSWRIAYKSSATGPAEMFTEMTAEISCPNLHLLRRRPNLRETGLDAYQEFLIHGEEWFYRESSEEEWRRVEMLWELEHLCAQVKGGGGNPQFMPSLPDLLRGRANIEKGERREIGGVPCRVWQVKHLLQAEQYMNEDICIGEDDHLPRERVTSSGRFLYSDWNMPMTIDPPDRIRANR